MLCGLLKHCYVPAKQDNTLQCHPPAAQWPWAPGGTWWCACPALCLHPPVMCGPKAYLLTALLTPATHLLLL